MACQRMRLLLAILEESSLMYLNLDMASPSEVVGVGNSILLKI
jgi:hypothetical protein